MSAEKFLTRHIGPRTQDISEMLKAIGVSDLDELITKTVPANIKLREPLNIPAGMSEYQYFKKIKRIA